MDLTGQKVLVVGGSKYLGEAVARKAAEAGASAVVGARALDQARAAAETLADATAIRIDITDEASIVAAAEKLGSVDHIVITASAHHNVPVTDLDKSETLAAFDAKVIGPLLVAKHFAPRMPPTGSIVLFSQA
ncbi:SDR family NAD(P)-dependent oxidoreductase [Cellulosimicrobium cellulans]|uniref:SDR family NAD(P)-dependent oxidoreductase n=1 Tax=Cellulosimicrobium cellulans TaxID=1710 RepID=UPI0038005B00